MPRCQHAGAPLKATTRLIDLSHTVEHGMITYNGLPAPLICDYLSREASRSRYAEGTDSRSVRSRWSRTRGLRRQSLPSLLSWQSLSELALESLAISIASWSARRASYSRNRPAPFWNSRRCEARRCRSHRLDAHWAPIKYFEGHPYLPGELAQHLVEAASPSSVSTHSTSTALMTEIARCIRAAGRGDPDCRASLRSRRAARSRRALLHAVPVKARGGHVPRSRLRARLDFFLLSCSCSCSRWFIHRALNSIKSRSRLRRRFRQLRDPSCVNRILSNPSSARRPSFL